MSLPNGSLRRPLKYLGIEARTEISQNLDIVSVLGKDYRIFGERLGFLVDEVRIVANAHKSPTLVLLVEAERKGTTIDDIYKILVDMGSAAAEVIEKYHDDIEKNMRQDLHKRRPTEGRCECSSCLLLWSIPPPSISPTCRCHCHQNRDNFNQAGTQNNSVFQHNRQLPSSTNGYSASCIHGMPHMNSYPERIASTNTDDTFVKQSFQSMVGSSMQSNCSAATGFSAAPKTSYLSRSGGDYRSGSAQCPNDSYLSKSCGDNRSPQLHGNIDTWSQDPNKYPKGGQVSVSNDILGERTAHLDRPHDTSVSSKSSKHSNKQDRFSYPRENEESSQTLSMQRSFSDTLATTNPGNIYPKGPEARTHPNTFNFITYIMEAFLQMKQFKDRLEEKNISSKCDLKESTFEEGLKRFGKHQSPKEWIEQQLEKAEYIIVLISPGYMKEIAPIPENHRVASPDSHSLHTRFIHEIISMRYSKQACFNSKIIPVVLQDLKTTDHHIPDYLRQNVIYDYPQDFNVICNHLMSGRSK